VLNSKYQTKPITEADVLYEDNHLIAINKRAGDVVQIDETGDMPLDEMVKEFIALKYSKPGGAFLGVVHRLDRPVSGLILFAKTSKALERMNAVFKNREVKKTYFAVVRKKPEKLKGKLINWLIKDPKKNLVKSFDYEAKGSQYCELDYEVLAELDGYFLLRVNPLTGRSHQIRVQLSTMGCPIVGDNKYGYPRGSRKGSICLHARQLEFNHPVKKEPVKIFAKLPKDGFWDKFEKF
jgi:23S rRNA pseudouridine1911/1915/1917 synthase